MARKPASITLPVLDCDGTPNPACAVVYHRDDGYAALYQDRVLGYARSRDAAEQLCREAQAQAQTAETAPWSYQELAAARRAGTIGQLLAELPDHLMRAQVVRFLVERKRAYPALAWDWAMVEQVERIFREAAAQAGPRTPDPAPAGVVALPPRTPDERAQDRALLRLRQGAVVEDIGEGRWLVASNSRSGLVHRVTNGTCSCEAHGVCWHLKAVELVMAQEMTRAA